MDAFGIRAIHPRPERRGFSRNPGKIEIHIQLIFVYLILF